MCRSSARRVATVGRCASGVSVARYYDPQTAQFLTRDPAEQLTRSAYGYAGSDPLEFADPSGMVTCAPNQNGGGCADGEPLPPGYDNLQQMYAAQARQDAAQQCQIDQIMQAGAKAEYWTNVWQQEDQQIAADQARADYYANKAAHDQWSTEIGLYNKYKDPIKTAVAIGKDAYSCAKVGAMGFAVGGAFGAEADGVGAVPGAIGGAVVGCAYGVVNSKAGPIPSVP